MSNKALIPRSSSLDSFDVSKTSLSIQFLPKAEVLRLRSGLKGQGIEIFLLKISKVKGIDIPPLSVRDIETSLRSVFLPYSVYSTSQDY